jgi:hypothetical protein
MARDYFKEEVAAEEARELVERLGYTLARSHSERRARLAKTDDELNAWEMIARRIRRMGDKSAEVADMPEEVTDVDA